MQTVAKFSLLVKCVLFIKRPLKLSKMASKRQWNVTRQPGEGMCCFSLHVSKYMCLSRPHLVSIFSWPNTMHQERR
jgi:hypothetical protein